MEKFTLRKIENLLHLDIQHLVEESKEEGFQFLEKLVKEYKNGTNTFQKQGESLYGVFNHNNLLVAIGGLNIHPFSNEEKVGRLRRFYISKYYRRRGLGRKLLTEIISEAKKHFTILVLYTNTEEASDFYLSCGFTKENRFAKTTHYLHL
jgi:N-acetylglutamate synthase-like GNAT family acetyltransferase